MTATDLERLRAWSHGRQRLSAPAPTAEAALRSVVAVYATHPTSPLALWARARRFSAAAYRRIDADRKGLRIPAMRGTIFLTPREFAAPMFAATRPVAARILRALARHAFTTSQYERFASRILAAAQRPVGAKDLQEAAGIKGEPLGTVLRCLRYDGRLLALAGDGLAVNAHRYVATSAWAPEGLDAEEPAAALSWLAGEYLRAYGPARVEDFAWWAGVTKKTATAAIAAFDTVDLGGGLRLPVADERMFARVRPLRGTVDLLPKWDAYPMGLAPDGRHRLVHPDVQARVYTPLGVGLAGDANPVVLVDGQVVATWTFTFRDGPAVQPFDGLAAAIRRRVDEKLEAVAGLLAS